MLGRAVVEVFTERHTVVGVDLPDGDLTDPVVVNGMMDTHQPQWVIHTAAFTDVDGSETHQEEALRVNGGATSNLATSCSGRGLGLTYLSTDYVFPGAADHYDEHAARDPVNYYGLTKARGEEVVAAAACPWQIVRTSWLFGPGPRNFVLTIRRLLKSPNPIKVVDDQTGCPTYAPDLAELLLCLVERNGRGYYHGTNAGACTWFQFAQEIARLSGADPDRIVPCTTAEYPTPARRPASSVLVSHRVEKLGCPPRPTWQDALVRYIRLLAAAESPEGMKGTDS